MKYWQRNEIVVPVSVMKATASRAMTNVLTTASTATSGVTTCTDRSPASS